MLIKIRHWYAAEPEDVVAMMGDELWLSEVASRAGADRWRVSVDAAGSHVHAEIPAPEKARRFTGASLKIDLDIRWQPGRPDRSRKGHIQVHIPGMPASMGGSGHMFPASEESGPGTAVDYEAEFTINVPLIGRSLESAAAPYVHRVIDTQQDVGNDYFAGLLG